MIKIFIILYENQFISKILISIKVCIYVKYNILHAISYLTKNFFDV